MRAVRFQDRQQFVQTFFVKHRNQCILNRFDHNRINWMILRIMKPYKVKFYFTIPQIHHPVFHTVPDGSLKFASPHDLRYICTN